MKRDARSTHVDGGDPEIAVADDPLYGEALLAWLHRSALLNIASTPNAIAGLRIVEHRILAIDLMLDGKIIRIGCGPMAFERSSYLATFHLGSSCSVYWLRRNPRSTTAALMPTAAGCLAGKGPICPMPMTIASFVTITPSWPAQR